MKVYDAEKVKVKRELLSVIIQYVPEYINFLLGCDIKKIH